MDGSGRRCKRAGIADRDIQTSSINLNPEYRYARKPAAAADRLPGDQQGQSSSATSRNGEILDALVARRRHQISGPNLTIDKPEAALDEARAKAIAAGRARAELYARALGMRVVRALGQRSGGYAVPPPMPMVMKRSRGRTPRPRSTGQAEAPGDLGDELRTSVDA